MWKQNPQFLLVKMVVNTLVQVETQRPAPRRRNGEQRIVSLNATFPPSPWKPLMCCHLLGVCHKFRWKHKHLRVAVKREGEIEMGRGGAAFANGSEVCRLKSVDNHGLALPSPSSSFCCVVCLSTLLLSALQNGTCAQRTLLIGILCLLHVLRTVWFGRFYLLVSINHIVLSSGWLP